ncbi:MAG: mandelate racemase/muconate lactonizing enzyme family protein [Pirellulales bacterium]|nr:mandelate racemase/muconate lactonizing enzyme family protein [Pirellulales bacterium]
MGKPTDVQVVAARLYFLPVHTRVPLKFGTEALTYVTCARAEVTVEDGSGRRAAGWGETPLSVQWVWPSNLSYAERHDAVKAFCGDLAAEFVDFPKSGHPLEITHDFIEGTLPRLTDDFSARSPLAEPLPYLASLLCMSVFDIALHDAFGQLHEVDIYQTYNRDFLNRDLASFLTPAEDAAVDFRGKFVCDFLARSPQTRLPAWHLVGGLDPLSDDELHGDEPDDGYPVLLADWIKSDGLDCLKIKLRGNDAAWDYERLCRVGKIADEQGARYLTADFNCTVESPEYVNDILDRLKHEQPSIFDAIVYVEQPFPYDLESHAIDVHSVSQRKPLFLDESAHDWKFVQLGRELGWSGVALKTCKTQTGALLSLCWAKAHGMPLMVQDLTNPMLAQIPHCRLAAHAETIMGVETNAMQFYPEASAAEAAVHPGLYRRRGGMVDLSTLSGSGFGYRLSDIDRDLPPPAGEYGT